ncbi:Uncharacterized protein TCM_024025 [Theobroma cacao]|uniref:Uncharacterized protein n=1 Tax=Theobroma cacao TaxID=3641 RepID=A0A061F2R8_THECC|nr:Uncharacterized protein TCM_024025 [Theobroma cacao]
MSRGDDSLDTPHSGIKGSVDSNARSQWHPDPKSQGNGQSQIPVTWIPLELEKIFAIGKVSKEKTKEAIAKGDIHPRKVSVVQHFPLGYGIGAALVSKEEYIRIQQAWIKDKIEKYQEVEEDLEEDQLVRSDQGDEDPKDA